MTRWTDNHCHLHLDASGRAFRDAGPIEVDEAVATARAAGVERMITVGCDLVDTAAAIAAAAAHPGVVHATAGVHPHEAAQGVEGLEALLSHPTVVAVGECGLDYHYDHSPRPAQREVFAAQIALARSHDLPLVIHTRAAWDDTFEILAAEGVPDRTVFHCFSGGPREAARSLEIGAVLSFSGIVTFKTADDLRAAAQRCPIDRLMVETDSPYLTPVPHRGERNRPALVPLVGAAIATTKGLPIEEVADATWTTASAFYRLD